MYMYHLHSSCSILIYHAMPDHTYMYCTQDHASIMCASLPRASRLTAVVGDLARGLDALLDPGVLEDDVLLGEVLVAEGLHVPQLVPRAGFRVEDHLRRIGRVDGVSKAGLLAQGILYVQGQLREFQHLIIHVHVSHITMHVHTNVFSV